MSVPYRGVSADQDIRFTDKQKKLKSQMKFPAELDTKVDPKKVNMKLVKEWVTKRITELLGFEDEVVAGMAHNYLDQPKLDGKEIQINLTGFLGKNTGLFMRELWGLLDAAQRQPQGIPPVLLEFEAEKRKAEVEAIERTRQEVMARKAAIEAEVKKRLEEQEQALREQADRARRDVEARGGAGGGGAVGESRPRGGEGEGVTGVEGGAGRDRSRSRSPPRRDAEEGGAKREGARKSRWE